MSSKEFRETVGKKIQILRINKGYKNQAAFARAVGVARSNMSQYESGSREPDLETICRIVKELGVDSDSLLGLDAYYGPPREDSLSTLNADQLEALSVFINLYQDLNEEGKKLLSDLGDFLSSKKRYRRDLDAEIREIDQEVAEEQEEETQTQ